MSVCLVMARGSASLLKSFCETRRMHAIGNIHCGNVLTLHQSNCFLLAIMLSCTTALQLSVIRLKRTLNWHESTTRNRTGFHKNAHWVGQECHSLCPAKRRVLRLALTLILPKLDWHVHKITSLANRNECQPWVVESSLTKIHEP